MCFFFRFIFKEKNLAREKQDIEFLLLDLLVPRVINWLFHYIIVCTTDFKSFIGESISENRLTIADKCTVFESLFLV